MAHRIALAFRAAHRDAGVVAQEVGCVLGVATGVLVNGVNSARIALAVTGFTLALACADFALATLGSRVAGHARLPEDREVEVVCQPIAVVIQAVAEFFAIQGGIKVRHAGVCVAGSLEFVAGAFDAGLVAPAAFACPVALDRCDIDAIGLVGAVDVFAGERHIEGFVG